MPFTYHQIWMNNFTRDNLKCSSCGNLHEKIGIAFSPFIFLFVGASSTFGFYAGMRHMDAAWKWSLMIGIWIIIGARLLAVPYLGKFQEPHAGS